MANQIRLAWPRARQLPGLRGRAVVVGPVPLTVRLDTRQAEAIRAFAAELVGLARAAGRVGGRGPWGRRPSSLPGAPRWASRSS